MNQDLRTSLARQALRAALETRKDAGLSRQGPVCIFDLCEKLSVEVRFAPGSSFGGMFSATANTILVPSERPPGRQAFTCAHELGHWRFRHGSTIDELGRLENYDATSPQEMIASLFAGYLLMPSWTVKHAFDTRSWNAHDPTPQQVFIVSVQMGVGFSTLVHHMRGSLGLLTQTRASTLLRSTPKLIRADLMPDTACEHLIVVDKHWADGLPIDLRVGDYAIVPRDTDLDDACVRVCGLSGERQILTGVRAGIGRLQGPDWASFIRVRRKQFVGRSIYRHLEDPDVNGAP